MTRHYVRLISLTLSLLALAAPPLPAADWPAFRGVNGSARADVATNLPIQVGPETNVAWKAVTPPGHSSPVIVGDRIYLTGIRDDRLVVFALERDTGRTLWEAEAPHEKLEQVHRVGSHAQASVTADDEVVVSFFGSCGLFCHDVEGRLLWRTSMGPFNNDFGAAISPFLVDDRIVLCQDHDTDSFLTSIDKRTGREIWRTDRSEFPRNYCTPVIATVNGQRQIVTAGTLRVVGYDFETGEEVWTVRGIARAACGSLATSPDGVVYLATFAGGGEPGARITLPPFDDARSRLDSDDDGLLRLDELDADHPLHPRFSQVDRDKSGGVTRAEYEYFRGLFDKSRNVVVAIDPGGRGDVTASRVRWEFTKFVPFIASPVWTNDLVFLVKDGGIVTSLDARSGQPTQTKRLNATGAYYSSPVAGDGKVYLINERGQLTVVDAVADWKVVSTAEFGEDAYATPAIVDDALYVRTTGHVYCFRNAP